MKDDFTKVMVIVSFTTSPTRLYSCRPMIESLLYQTRRPDAIVLNLPPRFDRTGQEYPPDESLPNWLIDNSLVEIRHCDRDWGPATKLVPTVIRLQQAGQLSIIISVDDDIRYPPGAISALAKAALPCAANALEPEVWCAAGFDFVNLKARSVEEHGRCCAVAEGFAGVAYPTRVFGSDFVSYMQNAASDADMRFSDDLMISNYLALHNVKRRVLTSREYSQDILWNTDGVLAYGDRDDALHRGAGATASTVVRYMRVLAKLVAENKLCLPLRYAPAE
jgi:hypothetical protein